MHAGLIAEPTPCAGTPGGVPSNNRRDAEAPPYAADSVFAPARARGGVVWIAGVAGLGRANLVSVVQQQLESAWSVELVAPEDLEAWLQRSDETHVAIVVASADEASESARARPRVTAADRVFIEILAISDWDALIERSDSMLFNHVADFFAQLRHVPPLPAPHEGAPYTTRRCPRRAPRPEVVIRLDWHRPPQIERRIAEALHRAGLTERPHS